MCPCESCATLSERVASLELQNQEIQKDIEHLKAMLSYLSSPSLSATAAHSPGGSSNASSGTQPFPALSPPSPLLHANSVSSPTSNSNNTHTPLSPKSPSLAPTHLLSKVSSRVQRILQKPDHYNVPVTIRRNSNTIRPTGLAHPESPILSRSSSRESLQPAEMGAPIVIPEILRSGITFLRVTHNKKVHRVLKLDENTGVLSWHTKPSSWLSLDRICDIYTGEDARNYREMFKVSKDLENRWATLIYQRPGEQKVRALHLVVATKHEFDILMGAIRQLLNFRREMMSGLTRAGSHFAKVHWSRASHNERIDFDEFAKLAKQLHINTSRHFLLKVFTEADADASGSLDFEEFKRTVEILSKRQDILDIYTHYKRGGPFGRDVFDDFMCQVQKCSSEKAAKIWQKYAADDELHSQAFCDILTSTTIFPAVESPPEDLDRPITEYWISSSHNTYLMGKQVGYGDFNISIEGYIRSLQNGCRCVEIDIWDGNAGPVVAHGSSVAFLTNSIELNDVIQVIRKYGFLTSPYPLILSLEMHCNHDNQLRVVGALKNILGDMLLTKPSNPGGFELPSPNELKHKVLIKVKTSGAQDTFSSFESSNEEEAPASGDLTPMIVSSSSSRSLQTSTKPNKNVKIIPELGELGVYLSARKFRDFTSPDAKAVNHCFSFSESTVKTILKNSTTTAQLIKHNTKYFARIYPSALKINSRNFNPMLYWRLGFQMVALNWQTFDLGMQLNTALFSPHIGYVHKPEWMRPSVHPISSPSRPLKFKITVISAQQLPRPKELKPEAPLNPCVSVERYGGSGDNTSKSATILDNGFNPLWNFTVGFEVIESDLEFMCVRFAVYNNQEDLFAAYSVKLRDLCAGYRHLPLQDANGEDYLFSSLFIKTEMYSLK